MTELWNIQEKTMQTAKARGWAGTIPAVVGSFIWERQAENARDWLRRQDARAERQAAYEARAAYAVGR